MFTGGKGHGAKVKSLIKLVDEKHAGHTEILGV